MTKQCSECGVVREASEFSKDKRNKDGLRDQCKVCDRQYRQAHKTEIAARKKQWNQVHKVGNAARKKRYNQRTKTERAAWQKLYQQDHKTERNIYQKQYQQDHKIEIAARQKQYGQTEAGKDVNRKRTHKYRALKRGATVENFSPQEVLERDRYICQHCGRKTRPDYNQYHPLYPNLDHIVPLSKGGDHSKRNTQCLCRECNVTKSNSGTGDQLRLF